MAINVQIKLNLPPHILSLRQMQGVALNTVASIKLRTSKGIDAKGKNFKKYSTKPLYVSLRGHGLKPLGGRKSRTGQSVFYQKGYAEYKARSKKVQTALVDLINSGNLMNNLVVLDVTQSGFRIGLTKHVASYGYDVNMTREFLGLTQKDQQRLTDALAYDIRAAL
jgi:hypothetical protein